MTEPQVEVTVTCTMRVDAGKRSCPWEVKGTTLEEGAAMHRLHIEKRHS
jgi:hypothetical protein